MRELADITIVCGHRSEDQQNLAFAEGRSQVQWPNSKHNSWPSVAVDVQPYPYPEKDSDLREELSYLAGLFVAFGKANGVKVRWGGDWNRDGKTRDNKFDDLFHIEIE